MPHCATADGTIIRSPLLDIGHCVIIVSMKKVSWVDKDGYKRVSLIRDSDDEDQASQIGVPIDPPDLRHLDWDGLVKDLHNLLVERGLFTWDDVVAAQNGVTSAIVSTFKRPIIALYKIEDQSDES